MKIYCVEEWLEEDEKCRDSWYSDPWKFHKYSVVREFEDEQELNQAIYNIIKNCGVIGKVWIEERNTR